MRYRLPDSHRSSRGTTQLAGKGHGRLLWQHVLTTCAVAARCCLWFLGTGGGLGSGEPDKDARSVCLLPCMLLLKATPEGCMVNYM